MADDDAQALHDAFEDPSRNSKGKLLEAIQSFTKPGASRLEILTSVAVDLTPKDDTGRPLKHVWHYTGPEAILSIVEHGELWASHIANLNDSGEVQYGWEVLWRTLNRFRSEFAEHADIEDELLGDMLAIFLHNAEVGGTERADHYFFSASANNDVLNQWQHYSSRGYAIAIPLRNPVGVRALTNYPRDGHSDFFGVESVKPLEWRRVLYQDIEQVRHAARAILDFLTGSEGRGSRDHYRSAPDGETTLDLQIDDYFSEDVSVYKHPAFAAEQEVRLSMTTDHAWSLMPGFTKARGGRFMQYQKVGAFVAPDDETSEPSLARIPFSGLRVGPADEATQRAAVRSVERMFKTLTLPHFEGEPGDLNAFGEVSTDIAISCSDLPYAP